MKGERKEGRERGRKGEKKGKKPCSFCWHGGCDLIVKADICNPGENLLAKKCLPQEPTARAPNPAVESAQ